MEKLEEPYVGPIVKYGHSFYRINETNDKFVQCVPMDITENFLKIRKSKFKKWSHTVGVGKIWEI